jgi:hypothetical protein
MLSIINVFVLFCIIIINFIYHILHMIAINKEEIKPGIITQNATTLFIGSLLGSTDCYGVATGP